VKILVLTPALHDTAPGQRFRIEQWARYLVYKGIEFTFSPFEDRSLHDRLYAPGQYRGKATGVLRAVVRRLGILKELRRYDAVFLYREAAAIGPAIIERLIARSGIPVIYDFDDPIWMPYRSPSNGMWSRLKCPAKTAAICSLASVVIVGNHLLASYARRFARSVHVVPSTIDLERYPVRELARMEAVPTLGWTGSHSTLPFLSSVEGALRALAALRRFKLVVISNRQSYSLDGLGKRLVVRPWSAGSEASDLQDVDIGLAPFPGTGWTPWRCHGKVLQYMAVGAVPVASPVGVVSDYIDDGKNGFVVNSEADWVDRLCFLIDNPERRRDMGRAARATVESRYSAEVWAPRVREIFEAAADSRSPDLRDAVSTP
jgi:glycosyltransferase involved in cell wall biosynthesis